MKKLFLSLLLILSAASAQACVGPNCSGGTSSLTYTGVLTGLPATCSVGQLAFVTDATAGQNLYMCTASNTWTQQLNSGSGGANTGLSNLSGVSINSGLLPQTGVDLGSTVKPFRDLFLFGGGTYGTNYFRFTGTPTGTRVLTLPDATGTLLYSGGPGGTPSSLTLTSATGLPLTTGVTGILPPANGGTGVANASSNTITFSGGFGITFTLTGATNVTFPTSGTLLSTATAMVNGTLCANCVGYISDATSNGFTSYAAGYTFDGTSVITLGVAGSSVGGIVLKNATSGSITINPATGALGSVTLTAPATTGTLALTSGNVATATALATPRSIYGNNFDGTAALSQIIGSAFGGTGNGFTKFSGPASSEKTFTLPNASATLTQTIQSGSAVLNPGALSSGTCSSAIDGGTATGVLTTDAIQHSFNADLTATTGYSGVGTLVTIYKYPTADHVNFKVCNWTGSSITPTSVTVNWRVVR